MIRNSAGLDNRLRKTKGYKWISSIEKNEIPNLVPSSSFMIIILLAFSIFVLGGGIYNIMERPLAITPGPSRSWTFYVPYDINRQTLNESILAMLLFLMGIAGYFTYYLSTRYVYSPRRAWIIALIGISVLIIAFVGSQYSLDLKVPGS
jgi:quinol-cytochrome oxidoreductase complex cytochrome b subunit